MSQREKLWLAVCTVVCALAIYIYPLALPTPLFDPDEGLHASISQEMVENGDYLMPRRFGKPFLDKPILYFDAQALSLRCFGMNEAAVRLPGLLFSLLGALTAAMLAQRLFGAITARLTLLISLTSLVPLFLAQAAVHDVALVPWTNSLLLCWWEATHDNSSRRRIVFTAVAALFAGLAILTKGLIGIAVALIGYALYVAMTRQRVKNFAACAAASLAGGLLLASPWFIAMEQRSPGYLYYYFVQRHILGFATHSQPHGNEPWYFYLLPLVAGTVPWVLYSIVGVWQSAALGRLGRRGLSNETLFVLCWLFGGLAFLSLAKSKLVPYSLPLYPAIAILAAEACKQFLEGQMLPDFEKLFDNVFSFSCVLGCLAPIGILFGLDRYNHEHSPAAAYLLATVAIATMIGALLLRRWGQAAAALATGALWFPAMFVLVMTWPMQTLAECHSQRQLAHEIHDLPITPDHITLIGGHFDSLIFYLEPGQRKSLLPGQLIEVATDEVSNWPSAPPKTLLVMRRDVCAHLPELKFKDHVRELAPAADYRVFETEVGSADFAHKSDVRVW